MNRYMMIPEDVQLRKQDGTLSNKTMGFVAWVSDEILVDPKAGINAESLFMAFELRQRFRDAKVGEWFEMSDKEWEFLVDLVKAPANGYNPAGAFQIIHFLRAVLDAKTEKPGAEEKAA